MTTPLPATQHALLLNTKTTTLTLSTTHPLPAPTPTSLLIRVHSTAITSGELTWGPAGLNLIPWPALQIPCYDVSGTVVYSPSKSFKTGDKIHARVMADRQGAACEYASVLVSEAARVPGGMGMLDAASVPMSAHTAWQGVFDKGLLMTGMSGVPYVNGAGEAVLGQAKGKRVLILGAAGSVGSLAVQFAKLAGAWVVGTASSKDTAYLEDLGIDQVVDYTSTSMAQYVAGGGQKFDVVFDCVGGEAMLDAWNAVKEGGAYPSVVPGFKELEDGKPAGVRSEWFVMEARGEELSAIGKFFEKGMVRGVRVDSVWKLEEFEEAFGKVTGGKARGKVVFRVSDEK